jgi:hypothetical protein
MDLSFREKYEYVVIVGLLVVYGYYFSRVLPPSGSDISTGQVTLFVGLLVLLIVIFVVGAIALEVQNRSDAVPDDERDKLITLKSTQNAHFLLAAGSVTAIISALLTDGNFWFVHVLLATLVLSQLLESLSRLYYYRQGV